MCLFQESLSVRRQYAAYVCADFIVVVAVIHIYFILFMLLLFRIVGRFVNRRALVRSSHSLAFAYRYSLYHRCAYRNINGYIYILFCSVLKSDTKIKQRENRSNKHLYIWFFRWVCEPRARELVSIVCCVFNSFVTPSVLIDETFCLRSHIHQTHCMWMDFISIYKYE